MMATHNVSRWLVLAATSVLVPIGVSTPAAAATPKCNGREVTVDLNKGERPTNGPDVILGTAGADRISIRGGDIVCAKRGDDVVTSGSLHDRNDIVLGGRGNDILMSDFGNNVIYGGPGNDRLYGAQPYRARRNGGAPGTGGYDRIYGGPGADELDGHDTTVASGGTPDLLDGGRNRPRRGDLCRGTPATIMRSCEMMRRVPA
jgi:Ca2+-binding RTX toxin-like protein